MSVQWPSHDGQTLASGSGDKTIKLWDTKTGTELQTLKGHSGYVRSVAFSHTGQTLASGSDDITVRLWDAKTGTELQTFKGHSSRKCEYEATTSITFSSAPSTLSILDNPLSLSPNTVWRERRAFAYYFQHAAPFVGGELDADFWSTVVPQLCQREPAVWDAINSISALFESPEPCLGSVVLRRQDPRTLNQNHRDALAWYSRSVSSIRQRIECGSVDIFVGLISCVLFICIEALQGCEEEALQLYEQGVRLILALRAQIACGALPPTNASLLEGTIVPIFFRLGAIAFTASGVRVGALLEDANLPLTPEFVSLKSAREAIVLLSTEVQVFQRTCGEHLTRFQVSHVSQELIHQQVTLLATLRSWHTRFTGLMETLRTKGDISPQQAGTSAILFTYHEVLSIIVATCVSSLEIMTDAYLPNFQNIVEQCNVALDTSVRSDGTQPPFTFATSVLFPLWFTSLRCREPRIRRAAIALMYRAPQVQGFYKCTTAASFAENIMTLEETYGMAMSTAQEITDPMTPGSTHIWSRCQSRSRSNSSGAYTFNPDSTPTSPDSKSAASLYHALIDVEASAPIGTLIPEEARMGHFSVFQPGNSLPPGVTEGDIAKWNRSRDQTFLRFLRNQHDLATDTWYLVDECIPLDF
ncbi:hypothetical protein BDV23DRAFT_180627 [Aspergillus alliaceus]|uniref:WD40-repeat-containing domain protein n=1 Tax=Petromyces alliaceus TaxID=209559 RepID=A0A5N7CHA9_PETAA|nr:hypothetical protein BDV23DRAFT_180627 [Aspergillus alliaceus]